MNRISNIITSFSKKEENKLNFIKFHEKKK